MIRQVNKERCVDYYNIEEYNKYEREETPGIKYTRNEYTRENKSLGTTVNDEFS